MEYIAKSNVLKNPYNFDISKLSLDKPKPSKKNQDNFSCRLRYGTNLGITVLTPGQDTTGFYKSQYNNSDYAIRYLRETGTSHDENFVNFIDNFYNKTVELILKDSKMYSEKLDPSGHKQITKETIKPFYEFPNEKNIDGKKTGKKNKDGTLQIFFKVTLSDDKSSQKVVVRNIGTKQVIDFKDIISTEEKTIKGKYYCEVHFFDVYFGVNPKNNYLAQIRGQVTQVYFNPKKLSDHLSYILALEQLDDTPEKNDDSDLESDKQSDIDTRNEVYANELKNINGTPSVIDGTKDLAESIQKQISF